MGLTTVQRDSETAVKQEWYKGFFFRQRHPYTIPVSLLSRCEHRSLPSASVCQIKPEQLVGHQSQPGLAC